MAAKSVAVASRSAPPTLVMVLEAMEDEDGKNGVSVVRIIKKIMAKYPEKLEARLRTSLKKAFEKALAEGKIKRPKGQADAGPALVGSFLIVKQPPAKVAKAVKAPAKKSAAGATKAPAKKSVAEAAKAPVKKPAQAKKPAAVATRVAAAKSKVAPKARAEGAKKRVEDEPTPKAAVKRSVSASSTASAASAASADSAGSSTSAGSAASFGSYDSLKLAPRPPGTSGGRVARLSPRLRVRSPPLTPVPLVKQPVVPRRGAREAPPTGKENVPPGKKTAGKKTGPADLKLVALALEALSAPAPKPVHKRTRAKAGPASKVADE